MSAIEKPSCLRKDNSPCLESTLIVLWTRFKAVGTGSLLNSIIRNNSPRQQHLLRRRIHLGFRRRRCRRRDRMVAPRRRIFIPKRLVKHILASQQRATPSSKSSGVQSRRNNMMWCDLSQMRIVVVRSNRKTRLGIRERDGEHPLSCMSQRENSERCIGSDNTVVKI